MTDIASLAVITCMPWRLRSTVGGHPVGGLCMDCGRDVAIPAHQRGSQARCIYCALDCGGVEEIEP